MSESVPGAGLKKKIDMIQLSQHLTAVWPSKMLVYIKISTQEKKHSRKHKMTTKLSGQQCSQRGFDQGHLKCSAWQILGKCPKLLESVWQSVLSGSLAMAAWRILPILHSGMGRNQRNFYWAKPGGTGNSQIQGTRFTRSLCNISSTLGHCNISSTLGHCNISSTLGHCNISSTKGNISSTLGLGIKYILNARSLSENWSNAFEIEKHIQNISLVMTSLFNIVQS